jgi:hypothetical protein
MITRQTNWNATQIYQFPLKGLLEPSEIMSIVKRLGVSKGTYEIRHENHTVKYGMTDASTTQHGERIYRQIGHLDSWGAYKLIGGNGSEFLFYNKEYKNRYSTGMNHNNIVVTLWSFDNYPFQTINTTSEIQSAEIELIENHKKFYGEYPIGNIDDGYQFHKKFAPIKSVFESLFDYDN